MRKRSKNTCSWGWVSGDTYVNLCYESPPAISAGTAHTHTHTHSSSDLSFGVTFGTRRHTHTSAKPCPCNGQASVAVFLPWFYLNGARSGRWWVARWDGGKGEGEGGLLQRKCNLHMHETVADIFADVRGANDSNQGARNDCTTQTTRMSKPSQQKKENCSILFSATFKVNF